MNPGDTAGMLWGLTSLLAGAEALHIQTLLTAGQHGGASASGRSLMLGDQADSLRVSIDVLAARVTRLGGPVTTEDPTAPAREGVAERPLKTLLTANRRFMRSIGALLERWTPEDVNTVSLLFALEAETAHRIRFLVEATRDDTVVASAPCLVPPNP